jgi:hypothetical protein
VSHDVDVISAAVWKYTPWGRCTTVPVAAVGAAGLVD